MPFNNRKCCLSITLSWYLNLRFPAFFLSLQMQGPLDWLLPEKLFNPLAGSKVFCQYHRKPYKQYAQVISLNSSASHWFAGAIHRIIIYMYSFSENHRILIDFCHPLTCVALCLFCVCVCVFSVWTVPGTTFYPSTITFHPRRPAWSVAMKLLVVTMELSPVAAARSSSKEPLKVKMPYLLPDTSLFLLPPREGQQHFRAFG